MEQEKLKAVVNFLLDCDLECMELSIDSAGVTIECSEPGLDTKVFITREDFRIFWSTSDDEFWPEPKNSKPMTFEEWNLIFKEAI